MAQVDPSAVPAQGSIPLCVAKYLCHSSMIHTYCAGGQYWQIGNLQICAHTHHQKTHS